MKFLSFSSNGQSGLAIENADGTFRGNLASEANYPGTLLSLIQNGQGALIAAAVALSKGGRVDLEKIAYMPPLTNPEKIICVGLNYLDHTKESGFEQPIFPTLFARFNSSLIGHQAPILRPEQSEQLDFEGELVAVIGKRARNVNEQDALDYVAGYSIFNDGSVRDYQFKSPQWTAGKNFDDTGAFGPFFVTADDLPAGCAGLTLTTRLNGAIVQQAPIANMVFSVARLVSILSEFMTLVPGDVIVTGTPSGVGVGRKPPLWMKPGDQCEVEIEGLGILSNPVRDRDAK